MAFPLSCVVPAKCGICCTRNRDDKLGKAALNKSLMHATGFVEELK